MLKIEEYQVVGLKHAIRGMRNPMNSWDKSDSRYADRWEDGAIVGVDYLDYIVGPNDHDLMMRLTKGGPVHAKYRRMITVYVDITAPLYWWKEFDTYKVGTVCNSCSTMHKIHAKEFTLDDFSCEHLMNPDELQMIINWLNWYRYKFIETKDKKYWWQMIQLLPTSYNQKRTIMLNYEVLTNIYESRRNHKLDEWHVFCDWIESLPYEELIIGEGK
jgi:hypothetical protein